MHLPKTSGALSESMANNRTGPGAHAFANNRAGGGGLFLGEVPFDFQQHEVTDILSSSSMEVVTGEPHVGMYRPNHPLHMNVVTDYGNDADDARIMRVKRLAARNITEGILGQLTSVTDRLESYAVGALGSSRLPRGQFMLADRDKTEEERAKAVARLSLEGLTLVISDFRSLPLATSKVGSYKETLALKVNHPLERRIPANIGFLSVKGLFEINTGKSRELEKANQRLEEQHKRKVGELEDAGITVVSVVIDPKSPQKVDVRELDRSLARGVKDIARR